jgi:methionine sulfoxide reductase heme-binding subunit
MWPWLDRTGRFSALRLVTFALIIAPAVWLGTEAVMGWFGPRPVTEAIHQSGLWAIRLLALSLAITPLRAATRASKLIGVRRMIGVASFAYAALHLSLYVLDQHFALLHVASEIALRIYLTIGFATLVILSALAATSTDGMIKRLGAQRWTRLHKWVYAAAALGTIHFFMQSKLDVSEPIMMGSIFALLLADRALMRFVRDPAPWALSVLAIGIGLATALFEAGWYSLAKGAPFLFVLDANLDFSFAIRPAWFVLAAGMALVAARILRVWIGRTAGARREQRAEMRRPAEAV